MLRRSHIVAALVTAAAFAAPAAASASSVAQPLQLSAPCSELRDTDSAYEVRLCGVTDVDQFRSSLINDGNSYCGPTSLYNSMQYIGRRIGAPLQNAFGDLVAEYDPANPDHYFNVTTALHTLGDTVGWLPEGGTRAGDNRNAFMSYAASSDDTGWSYATGGVSSADTAEFGHELAKRLTKAPAQLWYGRYVEYPNGALRRTGGHAVTVVSAKGSIGSGEVDLTVMDPGRAADHKTAGYLDSQSSYRLETLKLKKVQFSQAWLNEETKTITFSKTKITRWQISGPNYDGAPTIQMAEAFNWFAAAKPVG